MNKIAESITEFWAIIHAVLGGVWFQLHEGKMIRRSILVLASYIQYITMVWAMNYINTIPIDADPIGAAAMVAAVLAPASALLAAAIKFYNDTRNKENGVH